MFGRLQNCLIRNSYSAVVAFLCIHVPASATSVIVVVTPKGIVIGADGKLFPTGTAQKIFLLKQQLVVANLDTSSAEQAYPRKIFYNFPTWIKDLDKNTDPKVSVSVLATTIQEQIPSTFAFAIDGIKSGRLTRNTPIIGDVMKTYIVQYLVAGYERGMPTVYWLILQPNWDSQTVEDPLKVLRHPVHGQNVKSRILCFGKDEGISLAKTQFKNDGKGEIFERIPVEGNRIMRGKPLSLEQASNVTRAFLGIEAKAEPNAVGLPFTIVTIPKRGYGWINTYETDVAPLSRLRQGKAAKKKEK